MFSIFPIGESSYYNNKLEALHDDARIKYSREIGGSAAVRIVLKWDISVI